MVGPRDSARHLLNEGASLPGVAVWSWHAAGGGGSKPRAAQRVHRVIRSSPTISLEYLGDDPVSLRQPIGRIDIGQVADEDPLAEVLPSAGLIAGNEFPLPGCELGNALLQDPHAPRAGAQTPPVAREGCAATSILCCTPMPHRPVRRRSGTKVTT